MKCKYCCNLIYKNNKYCPKCGKIIDRERKYLDLVSILSLVFIVIFFIVFILVNVYSFYYLKKESVTIQSGIIIIGGVSIFIYGLVSFYYILLFIINILFYKLENTAKIIKNIILFVLEIIPFILLIYFILTRYFL